MNSILSPIGRCTVDFNKFIENAKGILAYEHNTDHKDRIWNSIYAMFPDQRTEAFQACNAAYDRLYRLWHPSFVSYEGETKETRRERELAEDIEHLKTVLQPIRDYIDSFHFPLVCLHMDDRIAIVTTGGSGGILVLPSLYVAVEEYKNYDALTGSQRKALLTGEEISTSSTDIADFGTSLNDARTKREKATDQLSRLQAQMQDVQDAKTGDLAEMQRQIQAMQEKLEAKKRDLMADLEEKKAAMDAQIEEMNRVIYKLDSEIYAIRCYTGETVEFYPVRTGTPASPETPLVIHQKLRYLDEELGKIASIYDVHYDDTKYFDDLLKHSPVALDTFAPTERSLMLARLTRNGKGFVRSEAYTNLLESYDKFHGDKICIVLRDGENVYLGWTDDDRINFRDDLFFRPGVREMDPEEDDATAQGKYESDTAYKDRMKKLQQKTLEDSIGRYFVFTIAQGVIDRGMIQFPEKVNVKADSPYIIRSYAEGWITDNKYGELADMIERSNASVRKGDMILTVQSIRKTMGSSWRESPDARWNNERGRGEKNRTHDVHAEDLTIYPVNLVEHEAQYEWTETWINPSGKTFSEICDRWMTDTELKTFPLSRRGLQRTVPKKRGGTDRYHYYVSLEKEYSDAGARANFEVELNEFWNLTFLNSVWLEYIITNHKTSHIRIGGSTVDFAHLLPYLKLALHHVREREAKVTGMLKDVAPTVLEDPDWPVKLSEYMLEKDRHSFGIKTVTGFAKLNV